MKYSSHLGAMLDLTRNVVIATDQSYGENAEIIAVTGKGITVSWRAADNRVPMVTFLPWHAIMSISQ